MVSMRPPIACRMRSNCWHNQIISPNDGLRGKKCSGVRFVYLKNLDTQVELRSTVRGAQVLPSY